MSFRLFALLVLLLVHVRPVDAQAVRWMSSSVPGSSPPDAAPLGAPGLSHFDDAGVLVTSRGLIDGASVSVYSVLGAPGEGIVQRLDALQEPAYLPGIGLFGLKSRLDAPPDRIVRRQLGALRVDWDRVWPGGALQARADIPSMVFAAELALAAGSEQQCNLHALSSGDGAPLWSGRVEVPPEDGLCWGLEVIGSGMRDDVLVLGAVGWNPSALALRLEGRAKLDGRLIWSMPLRFSRVQGRTTLARPDARTLAMGLQNASLSSAIALVDLEQGQLSDVVYANGLSGVPVIHSPAPGVWLFLAEAGGSPPRKALQAVHAPSTEVLWSRAFPADGPAPSGMTGLDSRGVLVFGASAHGLAPGFQVEWVSPAGKSVWSAGLPGWNTGASYWPLDALERPDGRIVLLGEERLVGARNWAIATFELGAEQPSALRPLWQSARPYELLRSCPQRVLHLADGGALRSGCSRVQGAATRWIAGHRPDGREEWLREWPASLGDVRLAELDAGRVLGVFSSPEGLLRAIALGRADGQIEAEAELGVGVAKALGIFSRGDGESPILLVASGVTEPSSVKLTALRAGGLEPVWTRFLAASQFSGIAFVDGGGADALAIVNPESGSPEALPSQAFWMSLADGAITGAALLGAGLGRALDTLVLEEGRLLVAAGCRLSAIDLAQRSLLWSSFSDEVGCDTAALASPNGVDVALLREQGPVCLLEWIAADDGSRVGTFSQPEQGMAWPRCQLAAGFGRTWLHSSESPGYGAVASVSLLTFRPRGSTPQSAIPVPRVEEVHQMQMVEGGLMLAGARSSEATRRSFVAFVDASLLFASGFEEPN